MWSDKGFNMITLASALGRVWRRELANMKGKPVERQWSRERDDGNLDGSNQGSKKWLNSGYILKTKQQDLLESKK